MSQYVFTMNRVGKIVPPKRQILKDISLSFFPGAKIGVLGLNGSGKSSLLKIMAGEDKNYDGEAVPMPNIKIGFLPQEPQLDPEKTVRECVEEGLGEIAEAKKKLDEIYAAYAEPDADFDKLAADQGDLSGQTNLAFGYTELSDSNGTVAHTKTNGTVQVVSAYQSYTWTGNSNGNWSTAGNWSPIVPASFPLLFVSPRPS